MSGRGKGGKGLGKGGAKRHRKVLRDNIQGITKPAIRRLARRGGVKRISGLIYEETRGVLKVFLENVIRDAVTYTEHARRKTVTALDVVYALKRQGRTLYGFGVVGLETLRRHAHGLDDCGSNVAGSLCFWDGFCPVLLSASQFFEVYQGGPALATDSREMSAKNIGRLFLPLRLDHPGLRLLNMDPPVFTVTDFVPQAVCQQLMAAATASGRMQRSGLGGDANSGGPASATEQARTSSTLVLDRAALDAFPELQAALDAILLTASRLLDLQALGQDSTSLQRALFTKPTREGQLVPEIPQGYQRRATLLLYLNDVSAGGATRFDHVQLEVQPRQGTALLFFPAFAGGTPDARTLHTAVDAVDEKWVFQLWLTSGLPPPPTQAKGEKAAVPVWVSGRNQGQAAKPKKKRK
ncbi:hypothetical protein QJQ45_010225 [Haematococcus lacustris]|nr:hypothetical protein QJQ45_010225 [Haematococcus lacustris]